MLSLLCGTLMFIHLVWIFQRTARKPRSLWLRCPLYIGLDAVLKPPTTQTTWGLSQGSKTSYRECFSFYLALTALSPTPRTTWYSLGRTAQLEKSQGTWFWCLCLLRLSVHSACSQSPPQATLRCSEGKGIPLFIVSIPWGVSTPMSLCLL